MRIAAARPRIRPRAPSQTADDERRTSTAARSDVRHGVADQRLDVAGDEHGVDACALELHDVLSRGVGELRDRELAGGDVRQELEQAVERCLLVVRPLRGQEEDLRVDVLERSRELVVVSHPHDNLDAELVAALHVTGQGVVSISGREDDGVGRTGRRVLGERPVRQKREVCLGAERNRTHDEALGAPRLRGACRRIVGDLHEHGDAVALGDRLAQPSGAHDVDANRSPVSDPSPAIAYARAVPLDVKRICLLGAESTGKSTLAHALAERHGTVWNPEYGRPYTLIGRPADAPWTSWEFTHIARIHCWYEDFLAESANRVLFSDTNAFTTALFHEVYLGEPATEFADLVERPYDLRVVCGLDVPWRHDGIREFEKQRRWMHERYLEHVRSSGAPWLAVEGPLEERVRVVADAVAALLG